MKRADPKTAAVTEPTTAKPLTAAKLRQKLAKRHAQAEAAKLKRSVEAEAAKLKRIFGPAGRKPRARRS